MTQAGSSVGVRSGVLYIYMSLILALAFGLVSSSLTAQLMTENELGQYRFLISSASVVISAASFGMFSSAGTLLAGKGGGRLRMLVARGAGAQALIVAAACSICVGVVLHLGEDRSAGGMIALATLLGGAMAWPLLLQEILRARGQLVGLACLNALPTGLFILLLLGAARLLSGPLDAALCAILFFLAQGLVSWGLVYRYRIDLRAQRVGYAYLLSRNRSLGLHVYWASLLGVLTAQTGIFVLQSVRTPSEVAVFALAMTLTVPLTLLPSSIGTAYFSRLPGAPGFPPKVIGFGWAASVIVAVMFCLAVPFAVDTLYGTRFAAVSLPAQLCSVAAVLHGMGDVYNRYYLANRETRLLLRVATIVCATAVVAGLPAGFLFGPTGAALARLASSGTYVLIMGLYYHAARRRRER